jgi:hypothetical protein
MAPRKTSKPGKTAKYYRDNPDAYKKKKEADKKSGSAPAAKQKRAELAKERRDRGVMGKGGNDMSHTKDGKIVSEDPKTNRARNRGKK